MPENERDKPEVGKPGPGDKPGDKHETDQSLRSRAQQIALDNEVRAAEKRLSDARTAAEAAAQPVIDDFAGFIGGGFAVYGKNLKGPVTINGQTAQVTSTRPHTIRGFFPADVKTGPVKVKVGDAEFTGSVSL